MRMRDPAGCTAIPRFYGIGRKETNDLAGVPYIDVAMLDGKGGGKGPMTELLYHVMSKEKFMNSS